MSAKVGLVLCPEARIYDHGPEHPLRPERVLLTWDLIHDVGLDQLANVERLGCEAADDATLQLVHTPAFIDATRRAGDGEAGDWRRFGYGPGDNPIFDRMHLAGALVAGASVEAARAVWTGEVEHAFNAAGGLHHAMPDRASGFCVYDDPAIAIAWLLEHGAERVAYVDVDVHHGDGPQFIFWDDPRVLTISIHEFAPWFFPGTGDASEQGGPNAPGSAVNIPLPPFTGDDEWLHAFRSQVPRLVTRVPPRRVGDTARVRHPRHRPAGADATHDARLPRDGEGAPRSGARGGGRAMGGDRRGRLSVGARRAARMDALLRRDGRRGDPRSAPRVVDRGGGASRGRRGSHHVLGVRGGPRMTARTKLICTLGPATNTPKFVSGLVTAGASVFRVNFSHGAPEDHARAVKLVRDAEAKAGRSLAVMADLPGPKVRLGALDPDPCRFVPGQSFVLGPGAPGGPDGAVTTYPGLAKDLRVGDRVLLADGAVELTVVAIKRGLVRTECVRGGTVRSGQGVNVPADRLGLPAVTDRDREGLARALDLGVDLIAQSFVRGPRTFKSCAR